MPLDPAISGILLKSNALRIQLRIQDIYPGIDSKANRHADRFPRIERIPYLLDFFVMLFKIYIIKVVAHSNSSLTSRHFEFNAFKGELY